MPESTHDRTIAEARGERETPVERLQRERDELLEALVSSVGLCKLAAPEDADMVWSEVRRHEGLIARIREGIRDG